MPIENSESPPKIQIPEPIITLNGKIYNNLGVDKIGRYVENTHIPYSKIYIKDSDELSFQIPLDPNYKYDQNRSVIGENIFKHT